MACDAATLEALQYLNKQSALSERDTLICLASIYGTAAGYANAQAAMNAAAVDGLARLSDRDLLMCFEGVVCAAAAAVVTGEVLVIEGDTIVIEGDEIIV